jgi:hypothetical protein
MPINPRRPVYQITGDRDGATIGGAHDCQNGSTCAGIGPWRKRKSDGVRWLAIDATRYRVLGYSKKPRSGRATQQPAKLLGRKAVFGFARRRKDLIRP